MPKLPRISSCLCVLIVVFFATTAHCAVFDPKGWRFFRVVESREGSAEGYMAIPLDARITAKCRGDLADLRVVGSDGVEAPQVIGMVGETETASPLPAKVFRISRQGDKSTDVWIDKGSKIVTHAITIETASRDFVRRVELRGSDNGRDGYVIRMNGLVLDAKGPPPIKSMTVRHPLNAHQYLHIRILDGEEPPLKIVGVQCQPPPPEKALRPMTDLRIIENRVDSAGKSAVVVAEMTQDVFPVNRITLQTTAEAFAKRAIIRGTNDLTAEIWEKISEESFFRVHRDRSSAENLDASFPKKEFRYWKIELLGGTAGPLTIDGILAAASVRILVFRRVPGNTYRLYYGKSNAMPNPAWEEAKNLDLEELLKSASVRLGEETGNITSVAVQSVPGPQPQADSQPYRYLYSVGVGVILLGLILLLLKIFRSAASRRNDPIRGTRLVRNRRTFR